LDFVLRPQVWILNWQVNDEKSKKLFILPTINFTLIHPNYNLSFDSSNRKNAQQTKKIN